MRLKLALAACAAICIFSTAHAQLHIKSSSSDPITGLSPEDWIDMMTHEVERQTTDGQTGGLHAERHVGRVGGELRQVVIGRSYALRPG